jgi:hypothetical protein
MEFSMLFHVSLRSLHVVMAPKTPNQAMERTPNGASGDAATRITQPEGRGRKSGSGNACNMKERPRRRLAED